LAKLLFLSTIVMSKSSLPAELVFDCINDQETADFIFDHCKKWLQEREWKLWTAY
jgi:hypothetical protein